MKQLLNWIGGGNIYGKLILLIGVLLLFPLFVIPFYPDETGYILSFAVPALASIGIGVVVCLFRRRPHDSLHVWQSSMQQGSLPVLFAWCYGIAAGAVPFVIGGQMGVVHALFESVSGWTTTGLTVADVTKLPQIFLFHRSFMQYCGGLGFIMMILLLVGGKQAASLFNAEGHPDRLMPNIKKTSQTIFLLYNGFLVIGTVLYVIFGMSVFDAICHTMSALSTAGFTTQANSIASYASFPIEAITILLMLIGSTNFAALLLLAKLKLKKLWRISELRFMIGMLVLFTPLVGFSLMGEGMGFWESMHQSLFGLVTTFTTTGYSTMNYAAWPQFAVGILILLMIIGGSVGSTAGGIKLSRTYLLLRITWINMKKRLSPTRSVRAENYYRFQGKTPIDHSVVIDIFGFTVCYMLVLIVGTLLVTLTEGCTVFDAMFEFTSALGTVGISNGLTNPGTNAATLFIEMAGMLLGRLEITIVFVGIYTGIAKAKHALSDKRKKV